MVVEYERGRGICRLLPLPWEGNFDGHIIIAMASAIGIGIYLLIRTSAINCKKLTFECGVFYFAQEPKECYQVFLAALGAHKNA